MKIIISLLFLVFSSIANGEGNDFANPIYYNITEIKKDLNLPINTSSCVFTVYKNSPSNNSGANIRMLHMEKVQLGINKEEFTVIPDWKGNINQTLSSGKYVFYFMVEGYMEVITDTLDLKSQEILLAEVYLADTALFQNVIYFKPVIYLYPEVAKTISVNINAKGNLTLTYPIYQNGWNFIATPDGKLHFNDKIYNYLFWESEGAAYEADLSDKTGFVVSSDTLLSFLENTLEEMNFTSAEAADFITFWYPKLKENEKNFIQFVFNEKCDSYAELNISPKPDHIFRVGMIYRKADSDFIPEKQKLLSINRNGFYVIEWGGSNNPLLFRINN